MALRTLTPEEKAALLARLEAREQARQAEESAHVTTRWRDLGTELDEIPDNSEPDTPGFAAIRRLFVLLERHRPAWQRDALCQEYPDLPWFPERGDNTSEIRAVCDRCVVNAECKRYAVEMEMDAGCWGGVVGRGLRKLRVDAA